LTAKPPPPARASAPARSGRRRVSRARAEFASSGKYSLGFAEAAGHSRTRGEEGETLAALACRRLGFLTNPSCRSPARRAHGPGRKVFCRFARRRTGKAARGGREPACPERRSSPWAPAPTPTRERGPRASRSPRPSGSGRTLSCLQSALPYPTRRKKHALGPKTRNQACLQLVAVLHQAIWRLRKTDAGVGQLPASRA